jgi:RNA polymerase sigma-70 factor, ECF subfamily
VVVVTGAEPAEVADAVSIADSDASQFARLVEPYMTKMANLAERLANESDRDDIVQNALVNAWTKRRSYDAGRGSLAGWLMAIVADQARKSWRRRWVFAGQFERPQEIASEDRLDLHSAVMRLPHRQRLAVDCFYFAGLNVAETSDVMRCSEGTVKSTLSDARRNLRADLGVAP